jgi:hypothetical protein
LTNSSSKAYTLTFKNIFGRGTLLQAPDDTEAFYHDLTPLVNDGLVINSSPVGAGSAYTNGKYTITDPHNLKQKIKKQFCPPAAGTCLPNKEWSVKVVSLEAKITSLKVIWKHVRVVLQQPSLWKWHM